MWHCAERRGEERRVDERGSDHQLDKQKLADVQRVALRAVAGGLSGAGGVKGAGPMV